MSKVSEHLHSMHKFAHEDRKQAIADHQAAIDKAEDGMEDFHKASIERHKKAMAYHADGMAECSKAIQADGLEKLNLDRLVPSNISTLAPPRPEIRAEIRAIPRFGSPAVPSGADARDVSEEFSKIFGLDAESQHSEERSLGK
jgi:hypothetical protein